LRSPHPRQRHSILQVARKQPDDAKASNHRDILYEYTVLSIGSSSGATMPRASIIQPFIGLSGDVVQTHGVLNEKSRNQEPGNLAIPVNRLSLLAERQT
jgi:hypothetical protein